MNLANLRAGIALGLGILSAGVPRPAGAAVNRPPQFVALAFDNCAENTRWEELKGFIQEMRSAGKSVRFTYFVSGVNFIADQDRHGYQGPHHAAGQANIDFGGTHADIARRLSLMHDVYRLGGEFGSHAVGHFSGAGWSADDWLRELQLFATLFKNAFAQNGYGDAAELASRIKGFRAPYLDHDAGLYNALAKLDYRYDTSEDGEANAWPRKENGIWMFRLANLRIIGPGGSGRAALSTDYNFYASQSHEREDPAHAAAFKQQMIDTYLDYFNKNYAGNRAPINIGHHFFGYQGGVYNKALKEFARRVCGMPEVRCVTYSQLADFMDGADAGTREAYQRGEFARAGR